MKEQKQQMYVSQRTCYCAYLKATFFLLPRACLS
uniref:Uncharacterized protein n=1 Tax=Anguilla anguilla TaxID=7936 RepID=A0A0E9P5P5_ANGAN